MSINSLIRETSGYFAIGRDAVPANPWQNLTLRYLINPRKLLLLTAITYQTGDLVVIAFHTGNSARVLESSAFRELARDYPSTSS